MNIGKKRCSQRVSVKGTNKAKETQVNIVECQTLSVLLSAVAMGDLMAGATKLFNIFLKGTHSFKKLIAKFNFGLEIKKKYILKGYQQKY